MAAQIFDILFFVFLLIVFLCIGKGIEMHHFRKLEKAEARYKDFIVTNLRTFPPQFDNCQAFLVIGSAVIATDYFKVFAAGLRTLFGGEIRSYATLMERARRQAVLRMLDQAAGQGATVVWNLRYETAIIQGNQKKKPGGVEVIVYGTALK